jgi:hypothetical protein
MSTRATTAREADVLDAVLDLLAAYRVTAWRINTGVAKFDNRFVQFAVPGFADIFAIPIVRGMISGIPVCWTAPWFLEIKSEHGKQSEEQKSFEKQVTAAGAKYFIIRSTEDMDAKLREHGAIL